MEQSKIIDKRIGFTEEICTQTFEKTFEISNEKIFTDGEKTYREWNPYNCKLAAAIKNGLQIMPILKNSKVLCVTNELSTIIHMSDIVGEDGIIFVKNFGNNTKIADISLKRENVVRVNKKINDEAEVFENKKDIDLVFLDSDENIESNKLISEYIKNLKNEGFLMIAKKNYSHNEKIEEEMPEWMKEQKIGLEQTRSLIKKLSDDFEILQVINLGLNYMNKIPYHKLHSFILARSTESKQDNKEESK